MLHPVILMQKFTSSHFEILWWLVNFLPRNSGFFSEVIVFLLIFPWGPPYRAPMRGGHRGLVIGARASRSAPRYGWAGWLWLALAGLL